MMTGINIPEDTRKVTDEELKEINPNWNEHHKAVCRCQCGATYSSRYQLVGASLKVWTEDPCPTCSRHDTLWAAQVTHDIAPYYNHHTLVQVREDPNMVPPAPR